MEELYKQVKLDMLNTILWLIISIGVAATIAYFLW